MLGAIATQLVDPDSEIVSIYHRRWVMLGDVCVCVCVPICVCDIACVILLTTGGGSYAWRCTTITGNIYRQRLQPLVDPIFRNIQGISPDFSQKMDTLVAV